jgi:HEAT repeat protein
VALGLLVGTFALILLICIGVPFGGLWLLAKTRPAKQPPASAANKEAPKAAAKNPPPPDEKAKPSPAEAKPAEKQAADYVQELGDADPKTREAALKALGKLKDESTIPAIAARLTDAKDRGPASAALKAFGAAAEGEVAKYLQEKDKAVRIEVCRILNKIGTKASLPALEEAAKAKEKDVAKEANAAIKEIKKRGT